MTEFVSFSLFEKGIDFRGGIPYDLPSNLFAECVNRWPQFKEPGKESFSVRAPKDSPFLHEILNFLEEHGFTANWNRVQHVEDETNRFQLYGHREFSFEEIATAEYLWCIPEDFISINGYRHDDGTIEVKRRGILKKAFGRTASGLNILCTDTVRKAMEVEAFTNIEFREVLVTGKKPPVEKIWEVGGMVSLPPVCNPMVNEDVNEPDRSRKGCFIDDLYFPPVLHFRRSLVVDCLPQFDLALTHERWFGGVFERRSPFVVVSQRFRNWVTAYKCKCSFVPVIMDDV